MFLLHNFISIISNFLRRNFAWVFPFIAILIFSPLFAWNKAIILKNIDHTILITVLSTLTGFLLTLLGILFTLRDKDFIKQFIILGTWKNVELSAFLGLVFSIIGMLFSFFIDLLSCSTPFLIYLEIAMFITTLSYVLIIAFWIKSCWNYIN